MFYSLWFSFVLFRFVLFFFFIFLFPCATCLSEFATVRILFVCVYIYVRYLFNLCVRLQSPPASAKVPKSVSDRKRFFENAMEDQNKPAPKSGELKFQFSLFLKKKKCFPLSAVRIKPFEFSFSFIKEEMRN